MTDISMNDSPNQSSPNLRSPLVLTLIFADMSNICLSVRSVVFAMEQQAVYKLQVREEVEGVRQEVREVKRGRAKSKRVAHFMSACG